tara:strand:- start:6 stop:440 length:435 start_codon:yes stop_codon:yes gene_type:complete
MNLKLAEYKDGKFERFLELGKDFLFGGDYIFMDTVRYLDLIEEMEEEELYGYIHKKDKTDPLNRFNGLFDGRTYGEGRFILINNDDSDVYKITNNKDDKELIMTPTKFNIYSYSYINGYENNIKWTQHYLGNLHENPELYEKVK